MRSRTSTWFECKIRYEKTMEDGSQKKVTELYVVDALSFTEAEASIIEEMSSSYIFELCIKSVASLRLRILRKPLMVKSSSATLLLPTAGTRPNCSLSPLTTRLKKRKSLT